MSYCMQRDGSWLLLAEYRRVYFEGNLSQSGRYACMRPGVDCVAD